MRISLLIILFLSTPGLQLQAQDKSYAKQSIYILCSPEMHGRGYVNDGDKFAAGWIASEFDSHGLENFGDTYFQEYEIAVNTFPGALQFVVGDTLVPGKDYILSASSHSVNSTFKIKHLRSRKIKRTKILRLKDKLDENTALVIRKDKYNREDYRLLQAILNVSGGLNAGAVIELTNKKLTHTISDTSYGFAHIIYKTDKKKIKEKYVSINIEQELISNYRTQNVIGYIPGSEHPDSFILFSAHYDHLGRMGKETYFPGANDDASGVAMVLDLARHYSLPENRPKFSLVFITFGAEETGLKGSKFYTENPLFPIESIRFMINMDIVGTGSEGLMVVNGRVFEKEYEKFKSINDQYDLLPEIKKRGKAANSDHYFFTEQGVHAFFIYTMGGIKAYHDVYDVPETLPLNEYDDIFVLITRFTKYLMD
ncbi:MAG: M28 family peptidase [Bacteroidetes bacterium]|nr:M28 family peptidase [Bacteroidota bacterium]